jgi:Peptidase propeptide and YPEB domain
MGFNVSTVAAIVALGVSLGFPSAELSETEEQLQFQPLPISMSMAVEAAEAAAPGQAIVAQLDIAEGRPVYEIHILGPNHSLSTVEVDAEDGEVAVVVGEEPEQPEKEQIIQLEQGGAI